MFQNVLTTLSQGHCESFEIYLKDLFYNTRLYEKIQIPHLMFECRGNIFVVMRIIFVVMRLFDPKMEGHVCMLSLKGYFQ
jgi:hypothetical protein